MSTKESEVTFDCLICFLPLTNNRTCSECNHAFCLECIEIWMEKSGVSCPACRSKKPLAEYRHNVDLQCDANNVEVLCENECGKTIKWGTVADHRKECTGIRVTCPFPSCGFTALKGDMDRHTARCRAGSKFNIANLVQSVLDRDRPSLEEDDYRPDAVSDEAFRNMLSQMQASRSVDGDDLGNDREDVVRHYVQDGDTLMSVSVKYGTTPAEITQLNQLSSGNLFSVQFILVPRPKDYEKEPPIEPSHAVLVAMRKRRLTFALIDKAHFLLRCNISIDEAVTYLHLTDYDVDSSFTKLRDDLKWADKNKHMKSSTFADFLAKCQQLERQRQPSCFGCHGQLTPSLREHCRHCGAFFCYECQIKGECNMFITKGKLGVTSPSAKNDLVPVCRTCFTTFTASDGHQSAGQSMTNCAQKVA